MQLISPSLNITVERRDVAAAVASPFGCPTQQGLSTLAWVPRSALGAATEIGAVMWTAAGDVHRAEPVANVSLAGQPTSFTLYTADNRELDVSDTPEPVVLSLSLDSESRGAAAEETLQCRYFDEALEEWSTEGCRTVDADGSGILGCHCDHLSDFIAVKVPTTFDGEITFANLDPKTETTLHCGCTKGVRIRINKGLDGAPTLLDVAMPMRRNESLTTFADGPLWQLVDVAYSGRPRRSNDTYWLATNGTAGDIDPRTEQGTMQLVMDPTGLAETSMHDAYTAELLVQVLDAEYATQNISVSVTAAVSSTVSAPMSVWGHTAEGMPCASAAFSAQGTLGALDAAASRRNGSLKLLLGSMFRVPFTACDVDALPVTHRLPRAAAGDLPGDSRRFEASISRLEGPTSGEPPELFTRYVASGRYNVLGYVHSGLGEYTLDVHLEGEPIAASLPVEVVCQLGLPTPGSLYPMPNNETCGCDAGYEPLRTGDVGEGGDPCAPCAAGHFKSDRGIHSCSPCPSGSYQPLEGQPSCQACDRGKFASASGSTQCATCGPGTGSEEGARICDACPAGTFALGGEESCQPCQPGTANADEGQAECARCAETFYAGRGFTECRACGMEDYAQSTAKRGVGVAGCDVGVINGTLAGYWAAHPLDELSGNSTRVWRCESEAACLGGANSTCREGHEGPVCAACKEGYYADRGGLCHLCAEDDARGGDGAKALFLLMCMASGLLAGCLVNLVFFKSDAVDRWSNFFYRVRTDPILFVAQIFAIRNQRRAAQRKLQRDAAAEAARVAAAEATPSAPPSPPPSPPSSAPRAKGTAAGAMLSVATRARLSSGVDLSVRKEFVAGVRQNAKSMVEMFRQIDEDASGLISKLEFRRAIPLLGLPVSVKRREIDALFDMIDADRSGFVDESEFLAFFGQTTRDDAEPGTAPRPAAPSRQATPMYADGKQPATPDMLSLSIALTITVKFIVFDLTSYLQVSGSFVASMPELNWPSLFFDVNSAVNGVFNLSYLTETGSLDCWLRGNYCFQVLCVMMSLVGFQAALPLCYALVDRLDRSKPSRSVRRCMPARWQGAFAVSEAQKEKFVDRSIHANVIVALVAHPPLSKLLLNSVECQRFNDVAVLRADVSLGCGTEPLCTGTAGVFMLVYTVGIPVALGLYLRRFLSPAGKERHAKTPVLARAKARVGFTCGKYEAQYYAYEVIEMTRKYLLTGASTLIHRGTYGQLVAKIVITFLFFAILTRTTPFNSPRLDMLVCTSHFCTLMTLMAALMIEIGFFEAEGVSEEAVGYTMLSIQFTPLLVALWIIGQAFYEKQYEKYLRAQEKARRAKEATKLKVSHAAHGAAHGVSHAALGVSHAASSAALLAAHEVSHVASHVAHRRGSHSTAQNAEGHRTHRP